MAGVKTGLSESPIPPGDSIFGEDTIARLP